jgi:hypothetical protein
MFTKTDFLAKINDLINQYPTLAPLYNAKDPRILMQSESQVTMLAMLSAQIETAQAEVFEKARDATVLADAAMRGIIRKATPARVRILIDNKDSIAFGVETGTVIIDSNGNYYTVETAASVAAGQTGTAEARQYSIEEFTHIVTESLPFYTIEIPESEEGSYLAGIAVFDQDGQWEYRNRYVNSWPDERIYHVESDDRQRVYVRFGYVNMVGTQPAQGDIFTLQITRTKGKITPSLGSPFTFDEILPANVLLTMDAMLEEGINPCDMATLRDYAKYPSVYDHNAVYLGEFDFLVRVNFPNVQFLSVWNESVEELARGASVDNINCLFIAVLSATGNETVVTEPDPENPVIPNVIAENAYTATQIAIKQVIKNADDSYKIRCYTPVISEIPTTITATVSTSYSTIDVRAKIREVMLAVYGKTAAASKRGYNQPLYREVYALLKEKIPALSDGKADLQVTITAPANNAVLRPELWRYISEQSLTVTVTQLNITLPAWGGMF